jgi:putative ABC transport system permease protein
LFQLKSSVEETWNKLNPETPFRAAFLDEHIEETYQFYVRLMRVFGFIGITAMAIAVLGLLGMASYNTERKTKEIGIRKVLGARIFQIVILLSRGFAFLLVAAAFIALPTAYLLFDMVILNLGVYRISIGVLEMSFGFLILLTVGFGVIFSQTIKVSLANPVNALRSE